MVIGVLGGMGTYATINLFNQYAEMFPAEKEWERPRIIIDNRCTMPSRVRAYLYDENVISIQMTRESLEMSSNIQWDGTARKLENIQNQYGYAIEGYCVDEAHQNYSANMTYGNGYYNVLGSFDSEEMFLEILNGIYFKNM